jgi:hypothetical protein
MERETNGQTLSSIQDSPSLRIRLRRLFLRLSQFITPKGWGIRERPSPIPQSSLEEGCETSRLVSCRFLFFPFPAYDP